MSITEVPSEWTTPKSAMLQVGEFGKFVQLAPHNSTICEDYKIETLNRLDSDLAGTISSHPSSLFYARRGIFSSCPGISEKFKSAQHQTDDGVSLILHQDASSHAMQRSARAYSTADDAHQYQSKGALESSPPYARSYSALEFVTPMVSTLPAVQAAMIDAYVSKTSPAQSRLLAAKDDMIEQKDLILQKQKTIIFQLRQANLELEQLLSDKQRESRVTARQGERHQVYFQEADFRIQQLEVELKKRHETSQEEAEKLKKKLGESEYECEQLDKEVKRLGQALESESHKVQSVNGQLSTELEMEREKCKKLSMDLKDARNENLKLQSYLEELPTAEDFKETIAKMKALKKENADLVDKCELLEARLKESKMDLIGKDSQCRHLEKTNSDLEDSMNSLKATLEKYKARDKQGPVSIDEHEELKWDFENLVRENQELKESLEKKYKKMKLLRYESVTKQREQEKILSREQETIVALREEIKNKTVSITKLSAQNQTLLEKGLDLQEKLKKYESIYNDEYNILSSKLHSELALCMDDLQSFVSLCSSRLSGRDPSLSALLGIKDEPTEASTTAGRSSKEAFWDASQMRVKCDELRKMRGDIDELRRIVSEHYAQEIGSNMCVTQ